LVQRPDQLIIIVKNLHDIGGGCLDAAQVPLISRATLKAILVDVACITKERGRFNDSITKEWLSKARARNRRAAYQ